MGKLWIVAREEFGTTIRRKGFLYTTALFPLLAIIAIGTFAIYQMTQTEQAPTTATVGYVDDAGFITAFHEQGETTFQPFPDRTAGIEALMSGDVDELFLIAPDYLATGMVTKVQERQRGMNMSQSTSRGALERFLRNNLLEGRVDAGIQQRALTPAIVIPLEVDEQGRPAADETFDGIRFAFFTALGFLMIMSVFMSSGFFLEGLSEEKETRIMEVLLSSLKPHDLMLGKLLGIGAVSLTQIVIWVASGVAIVGVLLQTDLIPLPPDILVLPSVPLVLVGLLYFVLGYAFLGTLMGALGAVTTSYREAQQLVFLLILPYIVPFWLMTPLLMNPDGTLAKVLTYIPFTAPVTSLIRIGMDAVSPLDLALSLLLLTAATALAVLFTLRLFRTYLLMFGRKPGLGEMLRVMVRG